jgi:hypothetical protein
LAVRKTPTRVMCCACLWQPVERVRETCVGVGGRAGGRGDDRCSAESSWRAGDVVVGWGERERGVWP